MIIQNLLIRGSSPSVCVNIKT